jgi:hypothetical protein
MNVGGIILMRIIKSAAMVIAANNWRRAGLGFGIGFAIESRIGKRCAAQLDQAPPAIQVRSRCGGVAAGIIGGMILGGIIASQAPRYYGYPPYAYPVYPYPA